MALSYTVPVAGTDLNSIADPEISTALNAILTWAAGNIKGTDISPTAGILGSQLSATAGITNAQLASGGVYVGATYTQGLLSARPSAAAGIGTFYYATDTSQLFGSNGTAWQTIMIPGAWVTPAFATGYSWLTGAGYSPAYRILGDTVQWRGIAQNASGLVPTVPFNTLTSGIPAHPVQVPITVSSSIPGTPIMGAMSVSTGGVVTVTLTTGNGIPNGDYLSFDNVQYSLN